MELKFFKEDDELQVKLITDKDEIDFSYISLIKHLYDNDSKIGAVFEKEVTEEEQEKIKEMLDEISNTIKVEDYE